MKRHPGAGACLAGLVAIAWFGAGLGAAPGPVSDPRTACGLLTDQRLPVRDGYREQQDGSFRCESAPRPLVTGRSVPHEIRYRAVGSRGRVGQLQLALALPSPGDVQPAYGELARLAGLLTMRALDQPLPAEAAQAISIGIPGTWPVSGAEIALERIAGAEPALRFVIRFVERGRQVE